MKPVTTMSLVTHMQMLSGDQVDMCIMRYNARLANRLGLSALQREQSQFKAAARRQDFANPTPNIVSLTRRAA